MSDRGRRRRGDSGSVGVRYERNDTESFCNRTDRKNGCVRVWCDREYRWKTGEKTEEKTAVIEIAKAAGLTLLSEEERNPLYTTTYGVGEVIKDAVRNGCRKFIVGIGGSATNDGGAGMLQALGFGLLKENGEQIPIGARGLEELAEITDDNVSLNLRNVNSRLPVT